jgi:hypothetical protein
VWKREESILPEKSTRVNVKNYDDVISVTRYSIASNKSTNDTTARNNAVLQYYCTELPPPTPLSMNGLDIFLLPVGID